MHFTDHDLRAAVTAGALPAERLNPLLEFLAVQPARAITGATGPMFDFAHLLWYAGALIVIGAMGLFSTLAFTAMGGTALTVTAIVYAVIFTAGGHYLWHHRNLRTPGGLLIAIAVSMAPLAVYGIQDALGLWGTFGHPGTVRDFYTWVKGSWVPMEIVTIIAGVIAIRRYPFPFIVMPIAVALWFMSMDLTAWIFGSATFTWDQRRVVSLYFGLVVLAVAYVVDRWQQKGDFAFWLHLFGMLTFWSGLSLSSSDSELGKLAYAGINVVLLLLSVVLVRRVYAVFGTLGLAGYLGWLATALFKNSLLFPFALTAIGVGIIAVGLLYHRNQDAIAAWAERNLPEALLRIRPAHAR